VPGEASGAAELLTEYCLLGPLAVRRGGAEVRVPPGQQRVLLAALLLRPGRPVPAGELAGLLWPEAAPASVRLSLQHAVMRLRRTLGDAAPALVTLPEGYLLRAAPETVDVSRFAAGVTAGQAAAQAGRWADAAAELHAALSLWRGEPLSGVPSDALAARERPRLAELRLRALEARIDADLHLGRHGEVITELRQLAGEEPLRERLHALLMLALYRDGQQAAALAAYQAARNVLIDELDTEPGPELRALHQQLLAHDPALAGDPAPAGTPGPAAEPEPPEVRYSLPPATAAFTGRLGELDRITGAAAGPGKQGQASGRVVAIRAIGGMPGIGKTSLAVHAAWLLRDRFPDRQLFVDLRGHTPGQEPVSPSDALAGLLAATGVAPRFLPGDLAGRTALWRDKMAGQRAVLVLDNAASSAQVAPLLPGGDSCLVLITSRRHLADLPGPVVSVQLGVLPPEQARQLLLDLAQRRADSPEEAAAVAELAELAGCLPLAITLLARLLGLHPSWALADLAGETRASLLGLAAEKDTVAAAFEVSYRHLDPDAQRFFRALGLHPGTTADRFAAAALAGIPVPDAAARLDRLYREGLLTEAGYRRYGMHDLIRQYAADRAAADPPQARAAAVDRLLDYYTAAAARAQALISGRLEPEDQPGDRPAAPAALPDLPDGEQALAWTRAERVNLLACLDRAVSDGAQARVVALTAGLAALLARDGPLTEASARHAAAAEAAVAIGDRRGRALALTDLADTWRLAGRYADAAGALAEAGETCAALGNQAGQARVRHVEGLVRRSSDIPAGVAALAEALAAYRDLGDRAGQAAVLTDLADTYLSRSDYPAADLALAEALGLYAALGDRRGRASALIGVSAARRLTGHHQDGIVALEQALAITSELGDRSLHAMALLRLGVLRQAVGDFPAAVALLQEALSAYRDLGSPHGIAVALVCLGDALRWCGQYDAAARSLTEALEVARRIGNRQPEANGLVYLGAVRRLEGNYEAAAACLAAALAIYHEIGDRGGAAEALNETGALHLARGDTARARARYAEALRLARELASPSDQTRALAGLARCDVAEGDTAAAALSLQQARQAYARVAAPDSGVAAELAALEPAVGG
jgi:DNA-binding SARP family transcriptional activator